MSNMNPVKLSKLILSLVLVLATMAAIWILVILVNKSIKYAIDPLSEANHQLGTQVANLLHPTPTIIPDPVTIIKEVQSIARLETIRYTVEKVVTAEVNQGVLGPLFGDRLLFVAHGYVIAGIDMGRIKPEDLWLLGETLNVRLPVTEILVATLDNDKSYVYDRETGLFTHGDPTLETQVRQVAEQEILKAAIEEGILDQATVNAQTYLRWFFETLGYKQINYILSTP
jgi:hypothetical protein